MQRFMRQNTTAVRMPVVLASAVALIAVLVVGVVVVVPGLRGARLDPAVLYGRWVKNGDACDTKREDFVIDSGSITSHMDGRQTSRLRLVSVVQKPPDGLELKIESYNGELTFFQAFTVKDPTTIMNEAGIWRKCP